MQPTTYRERKKEKNRNEIIECAVSLFKEKGFAETTIEEILDKAVISRGTLYNYFPDKESILVGYFQNKIASAGANLRGQLANAGNIRAKLGILLELISGVFADDLDLVRIFFRYRLQDISDPFDPTKRSGMESVIMEIIQVAQAQEEIRKDIPAMLIARNFQFLFASLFIQGMKPLENDLDKEQIIELFLHGAGASSPRKPT